VSSIAGREGAIAFVLFVLSGGSSCSQLRFSAGAFVASRPAALVLSNSLAAMSFSAPKLAQKLQTLRGDQESIQTVSQWIMLHKKQHAAIGATWTQAWTSKTTDRKLLLYLANDVLQAARGKAPELGAALSRAEALPATASEIARQGPEPLRATYRRLVGIWRERGVLGHGTLDDLDRRLGGASAASGGGGGGKTRPQLEAWQQKALEDPVVLLEAEIAKEAPGRMRCVCVCRRCCCCAGCC